VSDLGFPSRGAMCPSQQFSEGHFVFLFFFGGGPLYFFYLIVFSIMLSTNAMFKSELKIQSLSRGKVK